MAKINLQSNVPLATLDADINDSVTSLDVGAGEGATLPPIPFVIGINEEAMKVTNVATDTLTVTRAYVSTTAASHTSGDTVTHAHTHENLLPRDDTSGAYLAEADLDLDGNAIIGALLSGLDDTVIVAPTTDELAYSTNGYNGIMNWLGEDKGTTSWAHPETSRSLVTTSQSTTLSGNVSNRALDQSTAVYSGTNNGIQPGEWWTADFGAGNAVKLTRFGIKGYNGSTNQPYRFDIRGSNDNSNWTVLYTAVTEGPGLGTWWSAAITNTTQWRYINVVTTGYDSSGNWFLRLGDVEMWGEYIVLDGEPDGSTLVLNDLTGKWESVLPGLVDNAGTFEAQGDIALSGFDLVDSSAIDTNYFRYASTLAVGDLYAGTAPTNSSNGTNFGSPANLNAPSGAHKNTYGSYEQFQFTEAVNVAEFVVSGVHPSNYTKEVHLYYSQNGSDWTFQQYWPDTSYTATMTFTLTDKTVSAIYWRVYNSSAAGSGWEKTEYKWYQSSGSAESWARINATDVATDVESYLDVEGMVNAYPALDLQAPSTGDHLSYVAGLATVGSRYSGLTPTITTNGVSYGTVESVWYGVPNQFGLTYATLGTGDKYIQFVFPDANSFGKIEVTSVHATHDAAVVEIWTSPTGASYTLLHSETVAAGGGTYTLTLTDYDPNVTHWRVSGTDGGGSYFEMGNITFYDLDSVPSVVAAATAIVDNAGTFEATGDIDLNGNKVLNSRIALGELEDIVDAGVADGDLLQYATGASVEVFSTNEVASTVYQSNTADLSVDNNIGTFWWSDSIVTSNWIYFDMGEQRTLEKIRTLHDDGDAPDTINIEGSNDPEGTWDTIINGASITQDVWDDWVFTPVSYRYFRFDGATGGSWWKLHEVEFFESSNTWVAGPLALDLDGLADVSTAGSAAGEVLTVSTGVGKTPISYSGATATGTIGSPALAIDGDETTAASMLDEDAGDYIQVQFASQITADSFRWLQHWGSYCDQFTIQHSEDGSSWTDIQSWSSQPSTVQVEFAETTATYWRIEVDGNGPGNWQVQEMLFMVDSTESWVASPTDPGDIDDLGDVTASTATTGDVLTLSSGGEKLANSYAGATATGTIGSPTNAIDGDDQTAAFLSGETIGDHITVDFASPVTAQYFWWDQHPSSYSDYFTVQVSDDGTFWTDVQSYTSQVADVEVQFTETTSRYWRIRVDRDGPGNWSINEMEFRYVSAQIWEAGNIAGATPEEGESILWSESGSSTTWTWDTDANDGLFNGVGGLGGKTAHGDTVTTSQITTHSGLEAENALDTDIDINTGRSHTTSGASRWWMVEFNGNAVLDWTHFAIRAQAHSSGFNADDLNIQGRNPDTQVWSTYDTSTNDPGNAGWVTYDLGGATPTVDGIRILTNDSDYLILGSVEAWGTWYPLGKVGAWVPGTAGTAHTVSTTAPSTPAIGDVWVNPNSSDNAGDYLEGTWLKKLFVPDTAHVDDQEFDSALTGNTELTVSGTANWSVGDSRLVVEFDSQTTEDMAAQIWTLTPTSAPVTLESAIKLGGQVQLNNMAGIGFSDGVVAGSGRASMYAYWANGELRHTQNNGTFTAHTASEWSEQVTPDAGMFYHRIIWSAANTFKAYVSFDGVVWTRYGAADDSVTLTPDHIFVFASTWAGTKDGMASFEYLRVTESDLSL